jgi:RecA-family ATPase
MKSKAEPTFEIIESFLPQNQQILIAGTMKSNKTMLMMSMGMGLANNEKKFLEFDINAQGVEVLYVDSENGEKIFDYRMQKLATRFPDFANNGAKRFNYITRDSKEPDMMKKIDDAVKYFRPNVLVVDCLYNCTGGIDMGKDYSLTPVLDSITEMKQKYNLTIPSVHHLNKGLHE